MDPGTFRLIEQRLNHYATVTFAGDNILTAVSVAKECGIISPGETVVDVIAVAKIKDSPAKIFYTSSTGVSLFTIRFLKAGICGSWYKITSSCLPVGGRVMPTFYPGNEYFGHPRGFHL